MVLVDTSVWITHLRTGHVHLDNLLNEARVVGHPFVVGELACGHLKNRNEILSLLQALPSLSLPTQEEVLFFIERHALMGTGIGFIDAHLLAAAQMSKIALWTLDEPLRHTADKFKLAYHPALR